MNMRQFHASPTAGVMLPSHKAGEILLVCRVMKP